ncbi:MAG: TatD family hydrolase, partial [Gammaproteobacteria bacterium]
KPNQPAYVRHVAECIAEIRGESIEVVAQQTTENFFNLFNLAKPASNEVSINSFPTR